jgi:hypothetical protein
VGHQPRVRLYQTTLAPLVADGRLLRVAGEAIPCFRIDRTDGFGDPIHLGPISCGDRHQDDAHNPFSVSLRVGQGEG